jgi:hypothetical protein
VFILEVFMVRKKEQTKSGVSDSNSELTTLKVVEEGQTTAKVKKSTRAAKSKSAQIEVKVEVPESPMAPTEESVVPVEVSVEAPVEVVESEPVVVKLKKAEKGKEKDKTGKMKRLTLDIPKSLHKAIKAEALEQEVPMVDMLRSLLERQYMR